MKNFVLSLILAAAPGKILADSQTVIFDQETRNKFFETDTLFLLNDGVFDRVESLVNGWDEFETDSGGSILDSGNDNYISYTGGIFEKIEKALKNLNVKEKNLYGSDKSDAVQTLMVGFMVLEEAKLKWARTELYLGNGDAWRHSTWMLRTCMIVNCEFAEKWGTAHEYTSSGIDQKMDLNNNYKGRQFYRAGRRLGYTMDATVEGKLQRIVNASLVPTNSQGKK